MKLLQVTQVDAHGKEIAKVFINPAQILMITFQDKKHKTNNNLVRFITGDSFWVEEGPETFRKGGIAFEV